MFRIFAVLAEPLEEARCTVHHGIKVEPDYGEAVRTRYAPSNYFPDYGSIILLRQSRKMFLIYLFLKIRTFLSSGNC